MSSQITPTQLSHTHPLAHIPGSCALSALGETKCKCMCEYQPGLGQYYSRNKFISMTHAYSVINLYIFLLLMCIFPIYCAQYAQPFTDFN